MGRKSRLKKRRPPELRYPERLEKTASAGDDGPGVLSGPSSIKKWLFSGALIAAVFLAYQPAWRGGFIWDDDAHVTKPELRSSQGLCRIWFDLRATQQYYPLTHSVFWLENKLWGDSTLGYHMVNLLLHATAALLVASLLQRLAIPGAWLAAAIFALHPVQVESVAWITELKNTLSAVFYLGAAITYLRFDQTRKLTWYLAAIGLFMLGLLSKTVVATLPAALLVIFWWQRGRLDWRRDVLPLLPLFVMGAGAGVFTAWIERTLIGAEGVDFDLSIVQRCLIAGRAIWFYLGKLFWPAGLVFIYPRWTIDQAVWWQYLFPLAALLLLAAVWSLRHRTRSPLAAALLFVGTLFPVLGFLNVFPFLYSFVADHFQYLASLGIITLFSAVVALLLKRAEGRGRVIGQMSCVALLAVLALLTWRQSRMYADIETLYQSTINLNPDCWMAHNNLGNALADRGQVDEAMAHYRKALEIKPDYVDAHNNLGLALARLDHVDEAIDQYQKALAVRPTFVQSHINLGVALVGRKQFDEAVDHFEKALAVRPDSAEAHNNLGRALAGRGQIDDAIAHYQKALAVKPDYVKAHYNLGAALAGRGQFDEAVDHFRRALEIDPRSAEAHNHLGNALFGRGQVDEAIASFRRALEVNPDSAEAHNNLGNALAGRGQVDEAIEHFRKALEIQPDYAEAHYNLGNALAGTGQADEAVTHYRKALEFKPDYFEAYNNLGVRLAGRGQIDEAIAHFRKALEINSAYADAHNNLGNALASRGQVDEAITHFRNVLEIKPDSLETHYSLGVALASRGKTTEALEHYQKALALASARNNTALANAIRERIRVLR